MKNRFVALLLTILLAFTAIPAHAFAPPATTARHLPLLALSTPAYFAATDTSTPAPSTDEFVTLAQRFVTKFSSGDYAGAEAMFDGTMKATIPESALKSAWDEIVARYGAFKKQIGASITKVMGYDSVRVRCEFAKGSFDMLLVFSSDKLIAGMQFVPVQSPVAYKAPSYAKTKSFTEKAVIVGKGKWALHGTLTMPKGKGPFPAVVLVHGSGANDRDETIGPNKVFKDVAWGLASQGIAVLRYEKRNKEHAAEFAKIRNYSVKAETTDDAVLAFNVLRSAKGVNKKRVFILGHSLGGVLAPRIAKATPKSKGMIIMAGPTRPLEDIVLDQYKYMFSLTGTETAQQQEQLNIIKQSIARIKSKTLTIKTPASELLGLPASYWLDLRGYNAAKLAAQLHKPMLVLQGQRDYQVRMADFKGWQKYLSRDKRVTFKTYPKLNHLFMEGVGAPNPDEYMKESHIPVYVINDMARWIKKH
ncbi:MAG TPA: DUF3887 domain-containing protein [Candidatus Aquicultor sp.]|jgi:hypothetical protein